MKIKVELTIDIPNPMEWSQTYGTPGFLSVIRRDVKEHTLNLVQQSAPYGTDEVQARITLNN